MRLVILLAFALPASAQEPIAFRVPFERIEACSGFDRPTAAVIRDADTWTRLHAACAKRFSIDEPTTAHPVDFEREMVVVVYHGETSDIQPNSATISQIERRQHAVLVWTGRDPDAQIADELAQRRADARLYDAQLIPLQDSLSFVEHRRRMRRVCERRQTRMTSPAFMHHTFVVVMPRIDLPVVFPNEAFQPDPFAPPLDSHSQPVHCDF